MIPANQAPKPPQVKAKISKIFWDAPSFSPRLGFVNAINQENDDIPNQKGLE